MSALNEKLQEIDSTEERIETIEDILLNTLKTIKSIHNQLYSLEKVIYTHIKPNCKCVYLDDDNICEIFGKDTDCFCSLTKNSIEVCKYYMPKE